MLFHLPFIYVGFRALLIFPRVITSPTRRFSVAAIAAAILPAAMPDFVFSFDGVYSSICLPDTAAFRLRRHFASLRY